MPDTRTTLTVGGAPLSADDLERIDTLTVEESMGSPARVSVTVRLETDPRSAWTSPLDALVAPAKAFAVEVARGGDTLAVDARSVSARWAFAPGAASTLVVEGMDRSVDLDRRYVQRPWDDTTDAAIATTLFKEHGLDPSRVEPTPTGADSDTYSPQQNETDWAFLKGLAGRNGFDVYVETRNGVTTGVFAKINVNAAPEVRLALGYGEHGGKASAAVQLLAGQEVHVTRTVPGTADTDVAMDDGKGHTMGARSLGRRDGHPHQRDARHLHPRCSDHGHRHSRAQRVRADPRGHPSHSRHAPRAGPQDGAGGRAGRGPGRTVAGAIGAAHDHARRSYPVRGTDQERARRPCGGRRRSRRPRGRGGRGGAVTERARYLGPYTGVVVDNDDPDGKCRIKVAVPEVLDGTSGWCTPALPYAGDGCGLAVVPPVGSSVHVQWPGGDLTARPLWIGASWEAGSGVAGAGPETLVVLTPGGHRVELDDDEKSLTLTCSGGPVITLDENGITVDNGQGATLTMKGSSVDINNGALVVS